MGAKWRDNRTRLSRPAVCKSKVPKPKRACNSCLNCEQSAGAPIYEWTGVEWLLVTSCTCRGVKSPPADPPNPVGWQQAGTCRTIPISLTCEDSEGRPIFQWDGESWDLYNACACEGTPTEPDHPGDLEGDMAVGTCVTPENVTNPAGTGQNTGSGLWFWSFPTSNQGDAAVAPSGTIDRTVQGQFTGFGFSANLPSGATILGIQFNYKCNENAGGTSIEESVRILKAGSPVGPDQGSGTAWPGALGAKQIGGPSELYGQTWTDSDLYNTLFGIWFVIASVDGFTQAHPHIEQLTCTVYYSV